MRRTKAACWPSTTSSAATSSRCLRRSAGSRHGRRRQGARARRLDQKRLAAYPDVPTLAEAGAPGFDVAGWFMIVAPAKTPRAIVDKPHDESLNVMASPDVKERIDKLSLVTLLDALGRRHAASSKTEIVRWGRDRAAGRNCRNRIGVRL